MIDERSLRNEATELLQRLLRVDTSNPPGGETAAAELLADYLSTSGVECRLVAREPRRANLVGRIPGRGLGPSLALVGHTDVVPADDASTWRHPPFAGHVDEQGYIWGRGAADMKNELATRAVAIAWLARAGFRPAGDLLLIAEADEEDGTAHVGMPWLVRELPELGIDYAINEGAAERLELADGRTVVTINVGEKGALAATVTAIGSAGPSSLPWAGTNAVRLLAQLIERLYHHIPQRRLLPQTDAMLTALVGADGPLDQRIARACALHPMLRDLIAPLFETTVAPTRLRGSSALNVMPAEASMECDCRPIPGTSLDTVGAELAAALGEDIPYRIEFSGEPEGGSISPLDTPLYAVCREWVAENDPDAIFVPTLCNGFTNSHYLREAYGTVAYGFWPVISTPTAVLHEGVHGRDERVHTADLGYATRFHIEACMAFSERSETRPGR
jgi:acetylornithine deacetylase/succinyl-diaminopimelate desuccinylase-like protein